MQAYPSISVIIPSWNQGSFIERTLLSIINQDYPGSIQVIVSDGGSTDETVDILKKYDSKITWWSAKDKGFVDAVMKGAAKATGEVLAIQSSDDYYLQGAFKKMASLFHQYPDAGFVCGGECAIDLSGNIVSVTQPTGEISPETILFKLIPAQHSSFIKKELFEFVSGLQADVDMCADIDLWYRASHIQKGIYFPDIISAYQLHPGQRTKVSDKWHSNLVKMVELADNNPKYNHAFRLGDKLKKDLSSYWEMNWSFKRDAKAGKKVARKKILNIFSQSFRTNRMLFGVLISDNLKKVLPVKNRRNVPGNIQKTISEKLNWYQ